jgi:ribonuclease P protein component
MPGEKSGRFGRRERLKKRDEINRVFKKGHSVACPGARLFYLDNGLPYNRIVFTFARKFGNAVERNRARRLGREAYRLLRGGVRTGYDLALLLYPAARPGTEAAVAQKPADRPARPDLPRRMRQLKTLFSRAGLG